MFWSITEPTNTITESINMEGQPINLTKETHLADIYISKIEKSKFNAMLIEFERLKNVYTEGNDIDQLCISTSWLISKKYQTPKYQWKQDCVPEALKILRILSRITAL